MQASSEGSSALDKYVIVDGEVIERGAVTSALHADKYVRETPSRVCTAVPVAPRCTVGTRERQRGSREAGTRVSYAYSMVGTVLAAPHTLEQSMRTMRAH